VTRRPSSRLASLAVALAAAALIAVPAGAAAAPHMAGVQGHLLWANVSLGEMDRQLDEMRAANVAITRVDVGWSSIEHDHKGDVNHWYLDRLDHLVESAHARGIKLLLTLFQTPCWASTAPSSLKQDCRGEWWHRDVQNYAPRRASDYADALASLVGRYGDRVYSWEIWNEPNQQYFFRTRDPVGDYAAMVRAAYPAAKAADPRPIIVAGSLSDSDFEFADALYRRGVAGSFDAFSVHPYSADRSPLETDLSSPRYSFKAGVPAVHRVMRAHGDAKPLWLTEWGWSTCTVRGAEHWQNCVDPQTQATYLRRAFVLARSWSYVPVAIWFKLKNTTSSPGDRTGNYGLITQDWTRKPAFYAFRSVAAGMRHDARHREPRRRARERSRSRRVGRRATYRRPHGNAHRFTAAAVLGG
jgi:polysaccharide biosynthesis protein PslG